MKKIPYKIKDRSTLTLTSDAVAGDEIDLSSTSSVDLSQIEATFHSAEESVYKALLEKELKLALSDANLENEKLKQTLQQMKAQHSIELENQSAKLQLEFQEKEEASRNQYKTIISSLETDIALLRHVRSLSNTKRIGEDLEHFCDNKMKQLMQNGFQNCSWHKDNVALANDDETSGSKADFIFEVYSDESKTNLLSSVCLEMKSEDFGTEASNRQKNSKFYPQLDLNRRKKKCEYALLVTELEMDTSSDNVIYKVPSYPNMYQLRPAFLETFINLFVSFVSNFGKILIDVAKANEKLITQRELLAEFEKLKKKFLEKPLLDMSKKLESLKKNNDEILNSCQKIMKMVDTNNEIANKIIERSLNDSLKSIATFAEKIKISSKSDFGKNYKKIEENT